MHLTQRTNSTIRLAVLGALLAVGAVVAVPAVGAAVAAPSAPACGGGARGVGSNCWTTTSEVTTTTEETTTTIEETTTTVPEETTTTAPEVAGETTVPTTTPVTVAGATVVRSPGAVSPTQGVVTELAATGPSDGPALPVGLVLVALGSALALIGLRPTRAERSTD